MLADALGGLDAVELGHHDVHEHEVVVLRREPQKRLGPASDDVVGEPELLEIGADQHAVHGIVLDHEDMAGEPAVGLSLPDRAASARSAGMVNQNRLPWPGALSQPISPPISSTSRRAMERPSPVPPYWLRVVVGLNVRLKQPLLLKLAEADAGIGDVEAQLEPAVGLAGIGVQAHRAARGELHGVVDEVGEHLAKRGTHRP